MQKSLHDLSAAAVLFFSFGQNVFQSLADLEDSDPPHPFGMQKHPSGTSSQRRWWEMFEDEKNLRSDSWENSLGKRAWKHKKFLMNSLKKTFWQFWSGHDGMVSPAATFGPNMSDDGLTDYIAFGYSSDDEAVRQATLECNLFSCVAISDANFQQILEDCRRSEEDQVLQREWEWERLERPAGMLSGPLQLASLLMFDRMSTSWMRPAERLRWGRRKLLKQLLP